MRLFPILPISLILLHHSFNALSKLACVFFTSKAAYFSWRGNNYKQWKRLYYWLVQVFWLKKFIHFEFQKKNLCMNPMHNKCNTSFRIRAHEFNLVFSLSPHLSTIWILKLLAESCYIFLRQYSIKIVTKLSWEMRKEMTLFTGGMRKENTNVMYGSLDVYTARQTSYCFFVFHQSPEQTSVTYDLFERGSISIRINNYIQ